MVKVVAQGKILECDRGANLRQLLNGIELYNGGSKVINCRGIGTGINAVVVVGVSKAWRDQTR